MDNVLYQKKEQVIKGGFYDANALKVKARRILVLKTAIAGLSLGKAKREELGDLIAPGAELKLYREPNNEYDEWAIEVRAENDEFIGYVTRFKNEAVARLMDEGKKFVAVVDEPVDFSDDELQNRITPTENYSFPFSVYLEE